MNVFKNCWNVLQKCSLVLGLPVLLFLGLRQHKDAPGDFARHAGLAFVLLGGMLGLICWGVYEDSGLVWPGAVALGFLLVFGSALFNIRPVRPAVQGPTEAATAAPREGCRRP